MKRNELKQQVKEMSVEALQEEQMALLKEQMSFKIQRATGQLKKNHRMKEIRRSIARIKTLLTERTKAGEAE
jgi:large subunit ribosomal protein L29